VSGVKAASLLALVVVAGGLAACVPTGGVPASGAVGLSCDGGVCMTSPAVNCAAAEAGLEFAPFMVADFEAPGPNVGTTLAQFLYVYTDVTSSTRYTEQVPTTTPTGYEPPSVAEDRCASDPAGMNHVFHILGGPFLAWGGGMGISMQHIYQDAHACTGTPRPSYCPPPPADDPTSVQTINQAALDMSQWDGVAVWARRGPNSQPLLRVLVGDKFTDDDISFLSYQKDPKQPRFCERVLDCACVGDLTCDLYPGAQTPSGNPGYYCGTPGSSSGGGIMMGPNASTNTCNVTRCDQDYPAFPGIGDLQFNHKTCTPHAYRSGIQTSLCFNPGDPAPAEPDQQCGDHFTFPLRLTTEWQLYLVPFSSMSQQGWAKKAPYFDLKSVSVVRLSWDVGNIDYYVDNIRFYRLAR